MLKQHRDSGKQALLKPIITMSTHLLSEKEDFLREIGFDIERFDDERYIIRAIPAVFSELASSGVECDDEMEIAMRRSRACLMTARKTD